MGTNKRRAVALVVAGLMVLALAPATGASAAAQPEYPDEIVIEDGVTQPVFGYEDAIRERVWVEADFDSDMDGEGDMIAMDIMRPAASEEGLSVPVVMDPSPYFTTLCRGNEGQCIDDVDDDGINDMWPLFYDNYYVPRGYAVVLLHMVGTGFSNGCPVTGGTPDNLSAVAAIDWLNGRRTGVDGDGNEVTADWHNGNSGIIGKSYDGTLANAAAATGVEGLSTIVPIAAISSWYDYSRSNGIRFNTNYPSGLSRTVTNPARRSYCAAVRSILDETDGDETGDFTEFWEERDYHKDIENVDASVFVVHGLQDDNVKTDHASKWWYGLQEQDVPRKMWLNRSGHEEAFDFRRGEWVDTLHRWFDYWLHDIDNGIMDEPTVDVEHGPEEWVSYDEWPVPGTSGVGMWFRPPAEGESAGSLDLTKSGGPRDPKLPMSFQDRSNQFESQMVNDPEEENPNRLAFLSEPLEEPLHISGTPHLKLTAQVDDSYTNFGVVLVEYVDGEKTFVSNSSQGIFSPSDAERDCWGESSEHDSACYLQTQTITTEDDQWRVSKGIVDAQNIYDYTTETPLRPGKWNVFGFDLLPQDYVFSEGSRIGVMVVGSYPSYRSVTVQNEANITIATKNSKLNLPIVGGKRAALDAGIPADNRGQ